MLQSIKDKVISQVILPKNCISLFKPRVQIELRKMLLSQHFRKTICHFKPSVIACSVQFAPNK